MHHEPGGQDMLEDVERKDAGRLAELADLEAVTVVGAVALAAVAPRAG